MLNENNPQEERKAKNTRKMNAHELLDEVGIDAICAHVESGKSLLNWCQNTGFKYTTVGTWIDADVGRKEKYARAREARADARFEEIDGLSKQAIQSTSAVKVAGLRLASDNLKWQLARMSPRYKEKHEVSVGGSDELPPVKHDVNLSAEESYRKMIES